MYSPDISLNITSWSVIDSWENIVPHLSHTAYCHNRTLGTRQGEKDRHSPLYIITHTSTAPRPGAVTELRQSPPPAGHDRVCPPPAPSVLQFDRAGLIPPSSPIPPSPSHLTSRARLPRAPDVLRAGHRPPPSPPAPSVIGWERECQSDSATCEVGHFDSSWTTLAAMCHNIWPYVNSLGSRSKKIRTLYKIINAIILRGLLPWLIS